jgi:hypothetical protein
MATSDPDCGDAGANTTRKQSERLAAGRLPYEDLDATRRDGPLADAGVGAVIEHRRTIHAHARPTVP